MALIDHAYEWVNASEEKMLLSAGCCEAAYLLFGFAWNAHNKLGIAGFRAESDGAAVLLHDALNDAQADAGADAYRLRGVKGIEDVGLAFERDSGAVVADADAEIDVWLAGVDVVFGPGADADLSVL